MREAIYYSTGFHEKLRQELMDRIPVGNLPWCIMRGFENQYFDLAKDIDSLSKHSGIMWHGDLCLRPEALTTFIRHQPGYQEISKRKIVSALKDINALVIQEEDTDTVHLAKAKKGYSVPRVYRIRLNIIREHAQKY